MRDLYGGRLPAGKASQAIVELGSIEAALGQWPSEAVVWDAEDATRRPPWDVDIDRSITSLGNYFVTSDGRDLISVLRDALTFAASRRADVSIE